MNTATGIRYDMHTHSQNSHDSQCPVLDMAKEMKAKGLSGFAVTDHCDIGYSQEIDVFQSVKNSYNEALEAAKKTDLTVLKGIEIGESFWFPETSKKILQSFSFDVIIGSVHAVKFDGYEMPYSQIDFGKMDKKTIYSYLDQYFDDMLFMTDNLNFDILAHLTCPLRYINGKYGMGVSVHEYSKKIEMILEKIIKKNIALEVNTSCVYPGSRYSEFMPEKHIIKKYKSMGGYLITAASDAHIAQNAANSFDALCTMLKELGFDTAYFYKDRHAVPYKLNIDAK